MILFTYRRMIAVELFSDLGNQFVQLSLMSLVFFGAEEGATRLFVLCLVQQGPAILFSAAVGRWVGRKGPKTFLAGATLAKSLLAVGLMFWAGAAQVFGIYLMFTFASLLFMISRLTITPQIVPKAQLIAYNAVNERVVLAAGVIGPWLIGLFIRCAGEEITLSLGAFMFLCSGLLANGLPETGSCKQGNDEARDKSGSGWKFLDHFLPKCGLRVKHLLWWTEALIAGGGLLNFGGPHFNKNVLGGDIAVWGMVMSAYQAGAWTAALLLPRIVRRNRDRNIAAGSFLLLGACFALPAAMQRQVVFTGAMAGLGFGFTLSYLFLESRIQRRCPAEEMAHTMAALAACRSVSLLLGIAAGYGLTSLVSGTAWLMAAGAAIFLGGALVVLGGFIKCS